MFDADNFEPIVLGVYDFGLEKELRDFLNKKGLYCCLIFSIDNDLALRLLSVKNFEENIIEYNFPEFLNFRIQEENGIFRMYTDNKTIINFTNTDIKTYVKAVKNEIFIPVKCKDKIVGCIYLGAKDEELLGIDISELNQIIKNNLYYIMEIRKKKILNRILVENIILLNKVFDEKTSFMTRHSYNVSFWAMQIAKELNYNEEKIMDIYLAALMHDIGKIHIKNEILNKKDKLNEEEYEEIKRHVEFGYHIAKDILFAYNTEIPIWILQHHEKWDGTGYPNKLKGEEITKEARILKVADSLDAIISERSYKKQKNLEEALIEIRKGRGKDFDPEIIDILIKIINCKLNLTCEMIRELILPANLIFKTKDALINLNGYLTKMDEELVFKLNDDLEMIKLEEIENINLVIEKFNIVFVFKVLAKRIEDNKYLLKKMVLK